jgi:hypothetical protein
MIASRRTGGNGVHVDAAVLYAAEPFVRCEEDVPRSRWERDMQQFIFLKVSLILAFALKHGRKIGEYVKEAEPTERRV